VLVLTRRPGESILIGGQIRIRVLSTSGTQTRIAIEAPDDVPILREEVFERIAEANREAALASAGALGPAAPRPAKPDGSTGSAESTGEGKE
jgi:carbon storage regulator